MAARLLEDEMPAPEHVDSIIESRPLISWLNLAEVYYRLDGDHGEQHAVATINELRFKLDCELPTERRILEAARIKLANPIALADCFAISAARDNDCVLYTGDPEIIDAKDLECKIRDLRA